MPYIHDFSRLSSTGEINVNPSGWKPLSIEYGYGYVGPQLNFFWRVKETTHTFRISVQLLNEQSDGNYEKHIKEFLENFREDYISWITQGFPAEWMYEYHQQYKNFVEIY